MSRIYTFFKKTKISEKQTNVKDELRTLFYCQHWRHLMITSRITEGENHIFKSPLWRSVCVLVGPILDSEFLILDFLIHLW